MAWKFSCRQRSTSARIPPPAGSIDIMRRRAAGKLDTPIHPNWCGISPAGPVSRLGWAAPRRITITHPSENRYRSATDALIDNRSQSKKLMLAPQVARNVFAQPNWTLRTRATDFTTGKERENFISGELATAKAKLNHIYSGSRPRRS